MKQTKLESFVEASLNTASGFVVSFIAWRLVVAPVMGLPLDMASNLAITSFFTVLSVVRSYVWRRFFNARLNKAVMRWLSRTILRNAS